MRYGKTIEECWLHGKKVFGNIFKNNNKGYDYDAYCPVEFEKGLMGGLYFKLAIPKGQIRNVGDSLRDKMCLGPFACKRKIKKKN